MKMRDAVEGMLPAAPRMYKVITKLKWMIRHEKILRI
jgi:ribosomal protein L13